MKKLINMTENHLISETTEDGTVTMALMCTLGKSPEEAWKKLDENAMRRESFIYRCERIKSIETEIIL